MAGRRPVVFDRLDAETADRIARHPGGRELASGYASIPGRALARPGRSGGLRGIRPFGQPPGFGPADITAAGDLAARAAVCLDNARLYDRERRIARALQIGLLPGQPKVLAGLEVAGSYLPVGDNIVGGDWHDIVSLPGARTALIVGDAMATARRRQRSWCSSALPHTSWPPGPAARADTGQARHDGRRTGRRTVRATCTCTVIDPRQGSCVIAQAGHRPPVLVVPGGVTQVLDLPSGVPLGLGTEVGTEAFQAVTVAMPPGATLALYTDGLVEGRTLPLEHGMTALRQALTSALARPRATLQGTCAAVTRERRQHGDDDITLVLARFRG